MGSISSSRIRFTLTVKLTIHWSIIAHCKLLLNNYQAGFHHISRTGLLVFVDRFSHAAHAYRRLWLPMIPLYTSNTTKQWLNRENLSLRARLSNQVPPFKHDRPGLIVFVNRSLTANQLHPLLAEQPPRPKYQGIPLYASNTA